MNKLAALAARGLVYVTHLVLAVVEAVAVDVAARAAPLEIAAWRRDEDRSMSWWLNPLCMKAFPSKWCRSHFIC